MDLSIEEIQVECDAMRGYDADWYQKMMHRIPMVASVDRVGYILEYCKEKRVLHLGCNWPGGYLHKSIAAVASQSVGADIQVPEDYPGDDYVWVDLDSVATVEMFCSAHAGQFHVVVCAEILEHLGNPGTLLKYLRYLHCPLLITVPNAFSKAGYYYATSGAVEAVNPEHVAYYSYHTLKVLVERYGYVIEDWKWYNGQPGTAEGLMMCVQ